MVAIWQCWNAGMLECQNAWNARMLECWNASGMLECLECWNAGMLECLECWNVRMPDGMLECTCNQLIANIVFLLFFLDLTSINNHLWRYRISTFFKILAYYNI